MNHLIRNLALLALALALLAVSPLPRAEVVPPDVLVRSATIDIMRIVRQDRDIRSGHPQKVLDLVEERVLPHFDFVRMTQLAVGRHWPRATPAQQQALVNEFRTLLVRTYASALGSVVDYRVEFRPLTAPPGATEVTVNTEVSKPGAPPIPIDYRMMRTPAGWKVFDVLVDNVSLVTVYRNSFNSEVRRSGIDGLIAALQRRNQAPEAEPRAERR